MRALVYLVLLVGCHGETVSVVGGDASDATAAPADGASDAVADAVAEGGDVLPSDVAVDTDAGDAPPSIHGFVSTPGWVACAGATDKCYWSKSEYCCRATAGSSSFSCKSGGASCATDLHYKCDEAADCVGQPCAETPSGGSLCSNEPTWRKLCLTDAECASKECVDYPGWPGHGMCKS